MVPNPMRRPATALLLAAQLLATAGCHSWRTQSKSVESILAARPRQVRIATTTEPELTLLGSPRIAGDSLYGTLGDSARVQGVPLAEVTELQVQKGSAAKTAGLVVGITVGAFILTGLVLAATCEPSGIGSIC